MRRGEEKSKRVRGEKRKEKDSQRFGGRKRGRLTNGSVEGSTEEKSNIKRPDIKYGGKIVGERRKRL